MFSSPSHLQSPRYWFSAVFTQPCTQLYSSPGALLFLSPIAATFWYILIFFADIEMGLREGWLQNGKLWFHLALRKKWGLTEWNSCIKYFHVKNWLTMNCRQLQIIFLMSGRYLLFNGMVIGFWSFFSNLAFFRSNVKVCVVRHRDNYVGIYKWDKKSAC